MKRPALSFLLPVPVFFAVFLFSVGFFVHVAHAAAPTGAAAVASADANGLQVTTLTVDDKEDFVVEPGKVEVFANPGDTVTKYVSVTSRIAKNTKFSVASEDFVGSRSAADPVTLLGDAKSPYSLKGWLTPGADDFALDFGDRVTLPVTIAVPKNAAPGGYYAAVIISNAPQVEEMTAAQAGTAKVISRIGVLFFVRVNGDVNPDGHLEDFKVNPSGTFYGATPTDFQVLFNNTGSIYLAPYGDLSVHNFLGAQVADIPVDAYFAMPDSLRYRDVFWNDSGAFRFGRYTATLSLNRNYDGIVDTRTIAFWVLPWKPLTVAAVILAIIVSFGYFVFSRFEFRRRK